MQGEIRFSVWLALCLLALLGGCSDEKGFFIAQLQVVKNGAVVVEDKFNGTAPLLHDAAPPQALSYQLTGYLSTPNKNGAMLAPNQAAAHPSTRNTLLNAAMLQTNIDPTQATAGLKPGMAFDVEGTFEMKVPNKTGQGFYIGLTDAQPQTDNAPAVAAKDSISLGYSVFPVGSGINVVFFNSTDYTTDPAGVVTNLTYALASADGEQIKLRLRKADANTQRVTAFYAMVKNGVVGPYTDLRQTMAGSGSMPIFREHAYTRATFGAFWPKQAQGPDTSFSGFINTLTGKDQTKDKVVASTNPVIAPLPNTMPRAKQELIEIATRGRTARALLTYDAGTKPLFVALMIPGGNGDFRMESTPMGITMINQARLQNRLRPLLLQRGIASVLLDAPDDSPEMRYSWRETPEHLQDMKMALADIGKRFPGVPVVVVGHSIGAWSATYLTAAMQDKIASTILIAPVLVGGDILNRYDMRKGIGPGLTTFNWAQLKKPVLVIHHQNDACLASPYRESVLLSQRTTHIHLQTIAHEKDIATGYCLLAGPHNLDGHEVLVADSIKQWVMQQRHTGKMAAGKS